ncbi:MAG: hypothetical protein H0U76_10645 [Ktedonobacteraceae bacterium]|nr:hypothetical protein [Ktedonobacteraceae bacterium]
MPNFFAAAQRHLDDGDLLHTNSRDVSAVQLWGYGAECVLKAIALKQNTFALSASGRPTGGFDLHVNQARNGQTLISLYNATQSGANPLVAPTSAFFGWTIHERYEDGSNLAPSATYAADALKFRSLLVDAIAQGVLP